MERASENVVLWGDSLGKGVIWNEQRKRHVSAAHTAADVVMQALGVRVNNRARFGFTAPRGLEIMRRDLAAGLKADAALIEFGGNDCNYDWAAISENPDARHEPATSPEIFYATIAQMVDTVRAAGIKPILMTLPPINAEKYFRFLVGDRLNAANILKWLGDTQQIYRFQELYSHIVKEVSRVKECTLLPVREVCLADHRMDSFICEDGLHLTEAGQAFIGETITSLVKQGG